MTFRVVCPYHGLTYTQPGGYTEAEAKSVRAQHSHTYLCEAAEVVPVEDPA